VEGEMDVKKDGRSIGWGQIIKDAKTKKCRNLMIDWRAAINKSSD
jgi:hypothetical protein